VVSAPHRKDRMRTVGWPTAVVTGATSGIGRAVAQSLASAGASVGMVARDPTRGEDARNAIAAAANNPRLEVFLADLSVLASVRAVADAIGRAYPSVDILITCAAVFAPRRTVTTDGLELMFATCQLMTDPEGGA
jgi:NAD(P)-dependent dehydrogenase (short-subunit alcohol dehydrogenase family)